MGTFLYKRCVPLPYVPLPYVPLPYRVVAVSSLSPPRLQLKFLSCILKSLEQTFIFLTERKYVYGRTKISRTT
jgi:hypothetical protein